MLFTLVAALAPGACRKPPAEPEPTLERFLADVRLGRAEQAWSALSTQSREVLAARRRALLEAAGKTRDGGDADDPSRSLFEALGLTALAAPESVVLVSPPGDEIRLRVAVKGGQSGEVFMVREGAEWKVDLVRSLRPEAAPPAAPATGTATSSTSTAAPTR
jgi:hypothetical protein